MGGQISGLRGPGGKVNKQLHEQKSPCVLEDFVPFGTAAQNASNNFDILHESFCVCVRNNGWLVGWLAGWLVGWVISWSNCWSVGFVYPKVVTPGMASLWMGRKGKTCNVIKPFAIISCFCFN